MTMSKARQIAMPAWLFALIVVLGGCTTERPNDLPGNATLGAEGNREVHFMAPSSGTAYVYDNNNEHLIWSGAVHKGDTIDVDPDNNRITVADKKVTTQTLARGRDH